MDDRGSLIEKARDALQELVGIVAHLEQNPTGRRDMALVDAIDLLTALAGLTFQIHEDGTLTLEDAS